MYCKPVSGDGQDAKVDDTMRALHPLWKLKLTKKGQVMLIDENFFPEGWMHVAIFRLYLPP